MGSRLTEGRGGGQSGGNLPPLGKNSSGVATDLLRMVRQQKLQRLKLCKDPIYIQYLSAEKQRVIHMRRKGWVEHGARPQMDDDLDSEARQRVTALVSSASRSRGGGQAGVWAPFGKPYRALGKLTQEFEIAQKHVPATHKEAHHQITDVPEGPSRSHAQSGDGQDAIMKTNQTMSSPQETKFAEVPIRSAAARTRAARIVTPWFNPSLAAADRKDTAQYGQNSRHDQASVALHIKTQVRQRLECHPDHVACAALGPVLFTQSRPGVPSEPPGVDPAKTQQVCPELMHSRTETQAAQRTSMSSSQQVDKSVPESQEQLTTLESIATGYSAAVSDIGLAEEEPDWAALNHFHANLPSIQPEHTVRHWHIRFMQAKAKGRIQMQRLLWQRLQGRCQARAQSGLAAGFYNAIVSELEYSLGHRPACAVAGIPPRDPYDQAKMFMDHVQDDTAPVRKAPGQLQLEDVHILERFYNQLCLLVEAQCPSDPMSLLCVQNVKELLESGHTLHKPLLYNLLERFATFVHSVGMTKPNMYLLPMFTFIQRCCGVSDTALEQMLMKHGLCQILLGSDCDDDLARPVTPLGLHRRCTHASRPQTATSKRKESMAAQVLATRL
eukprot:jgi/Ulvmu1/4435/UM002_0160.1